MYNYIWEFTVRPECEGAFLSLYGPQGAWVALFRTSPEYVDTRLLCDMARADRFVTVDRWTSREAFERFRASRAADFEAIDTSGERLTLSEHALGHFEEAP